MASSGQVKAWITHERRRLLEDVADLDEQVWDTPSSCEGWTVRDVLAHIVAPYVSSPWRTGRMMMRYGPAGAMDRNAREVAERGTAQLLTDLEDHADDVFVPPLVGPSAPLTDVIVHGCDIRIPLGIPTEFDGDRLATVLGFVTSTKASPVFLPRSRLRRLRLRATDISFASGSGAEVAGEALDLALGILGRSNGLDRCEGVGVAILHARIA